MNELIPFDFDDTRVRAVMIGSDPWWIANDVAQVLGYNHAPHMVRILDEDEKGVHILDSGWNTNESATIAAPPQTLTIISESGLFAVILKSRKPEARRFRRWVTGEVLPALRRHGHYSAPLPADTAVEEFDSARLSASVSAVREARRLFGPQTARTIWMRLGLPAPIAQSLPCLPADPLAAPIETYLATVEATTIDEAAQALNLASIDAGMRLRIGALLRLFGWLPRKVRRGHQTVNLFAPSVVEA